MKMVWNKGMMKPGKPSRQPVTRREALAAGGAVALLTASGTGAVKSSVEEKFGKFVSVQDFGAVGDGVVDDTEAIQTALNAAKGGDGNAAGRTVFSLYFPSVPGGFYKVTDTLVIDGTHGLVVFGDGALTERGDQNATVRWYGSNSKPVFQLKGGTGTPSNPNFYIAFRDLTISGYPTSLPRKDEPPAALALSGIHVGNLDGQDDNTLCRRAIVENVQISNCRFGIWSGNPDGKNTDHATILVTGCVIHNNAGAGIHWGTGNALANVISCDLSGNGFAGGSYARDSYSAPIGANIHVESGYMDIVSYTSAGKPTSADIYQSSGRVSIINAWSDVHGYFFYQASASPSGRAYHVGQITGVRHYEGSMDATNTPNSIRIVAPGTFVSSCMVYGNIEVASGLGGRPVFAGINFIRPGATYTGSGVDTQRSLTVLGNAGNFAQILLGGADAGVPLAHKGKATPQILSMGDNPCLFQVLDASSAGSGLSFHTRTDDANGSHSLLLNGFFTATGVQPLQTDKMVWWLKLGGSQGLRVSGFDPDGSSDAITFDSFIVFGG
ncbi:MAG: glycosyl hydrolase family 28-related protein, partial [Pirellulaceae bacterium]